MLNFIASWHREREAVRELSRLTDLELVDLGIGRSNMRALARSEGCDGRPSPALPAADTAAPSWGAHLRRPNPA